MNNVLISATNKKKLNLYIILCSQPGSLFITIEGLLGAIIIIMSSQVIRYFPNHCDS